MLSHLHTYQYNYNHHALLYSYIIFQIVAAVHTYMCMGQQNCVYLHNDMTSGKLMILFLLGTIYDIIIHYVFYKLHQQFSYFSNTL